MPASRRAQVGFVGFTLLFGLFASIQATLDPRFRSDVADSLAGGIYLKVVGWATSRPLEATTSESSNFSDPSTLQEFHFDGRRLGIQSAEGIAYPSRRFVVSALGRMEVVCSEAGQGCFSNLLPGAPSAAEGWRLVPDQGSEAGSAAQCLGAVTDALTSLSSDRKSQFADGELLISCAQKSSELLQYLAVPVAHECVGGRDFVERVSKLFVQQARFGRHFSRLRAPIFSYYSDLARCAGSLGLTELTEIALYRAQALYERMSWASHQILIDSNSRSIQLVPIVQSVDTGFHIGGVIGISEPGERVNELIRLRAQALAAPSPAGFEKYLEGSWIDEQRLFLRDLAELRLGTEPALVREAFARLMARHPVADSDLDEAFVRFGISKTNGDEGYSAKKARLIRALRGEI